MIKYQPGNNYLDPNGILMNNNQNGGNNAQPLQNGMNNINNVNNVNSLNNLNNLNNVDNISNISNISNINNINNINNKKDSQTNDNYAQNDLIISPNIYPTPQQALFASNSLLNFCNYNGQLTPENIPYSYFPTNQPFNVIQYGPSTESYSHLNINAVFQPQMNPGHLPLTYSQFSCIQQPNGQAIGADGRTGIKNPQYAKPDQSYENLHQQLEASRQSNNLNLSPIIYDNFRMGYPDCNLKEIQVFSPSDLRMMGVNPQSPIKISLENTTLWNSFCRFGNEMIITKHGRRIYPYLSIHISGLAPYKKYRIKSGFSQASTHRYKFQKNKGWKLGNSNEVLVRPATLYNHPDGIQTGEYWMNKTVNFLRMKVTNNPHNKEYIHLNSMHLYLISVYVIEIDDQQNEYLIYREDFQETKFIAVTAYQNKKITKLKIQHNHYAKGFKNGQRKIKESSDGVDSDNFVNPLTDKDL